MGQDEIPVHKSMPDTRLFCVQMTELQDRVAKLEGMCKAKYEAGEKGQAYQQFTEKYSGVSSTVCSFPHWSPRITKTLPCLNAAQVQQVLMSPFHV